MRKIIIVGSVAGGATAAARLRRLSEDDQIILFERDEYISFANCGLPYYIGDVIKERDKLFVQTIEGMSQRFKLDIRNFSEVVAVNRAEKNVVVRSVKTGETYTESYDVLILSPGAKPVKPKFPGVENANNVFVLRNIPDTDRIRGFVDINKPQTAVVIGGGFIGVEMAENLAERGVQVTLVEKMSQALAPFDFEMAQIIHQELNAHGVRVILGDGVSRFAENGGKVVLESGTELAAGLTVLAIGVAPENTLAKSCGLALGERGHIKTDEKLHVIDAATGKPVPDVYAVGDAIQVKDYVTGSDTAIPLAWPANRQGRLVADIINGMDEVYDGSLGTSVLKVFSLTGASTGANERALKAKGLPYMAVHAHRANHASYYPDSSNIALKLLFNPETGKIYGAQAVGQEGTEKRIDVIATAIKLGGTIRDLPRLELAYAPPYSSAKDPVNILGYIACNAANGVFGLAHWYEMDQIAKDGGYLLDVRTPVEFQVGHIEGAVNIELDSLRDRIGEITVSKDTPIYVNCQVGLRAYLAIQILKAYGFTKLYNVSGGYLTYKTAKYAPKSDVNIKTDVDTQVKLPAVHEKPVKTVDVTGLQCPGPLLAAYRAVSELQSGDRVRVISTDYGFARDVENWCRTNGHELVSLTNEKNKYAALIQKGDAKAQCTVNAVPTQENATIVLFSGELDRALAAMIIAQGAAAQGKKVTIFFTFWGLNALRKDKRVHVKKNAIEKMFGTMMPRGARRMPLSSMNMLGMGQKMIKSIMKKKNVDDIDSMIKSAQNLGIKFVACTMSMDLMGIKQEELIDGVELGGVATYISSNENVGTTLFI